MSEKLGTRASMTTTEQQRNIGSPSVYRTQKRTSILSELRNAPLPQMPSTSAYGSRVRLDDGYKLTCIHPSERSPPDRSDYEDGYSSSSSYIYQDSDDGSTNQQAGAYVGAPEEGGTARSAAVAARLLLDSAEPGTQLQSNSDMRLTSPSPDRSGSEPVSSSHRIAESRQRSRPGPQLRPNSDVRMTSPSSDGSGSEPISSSQRIAESRQRSRRKPKSSDRS